MFFWSTSAAQRSLCQKKNRNLSCPVNQQSINSNHQNVSNSTDRQQKSYYKILITILHLNTVLDLCAKRKIETSTLSCPVNQLSINSNHQNVPNSIDRQQTSYYKILITVCHFYTELNTVLDFVRPKELFHIIRAHYMTYTHAGEVAKQLVFYSDDQNITQKVKKYENNELVISRMSTVRPEKRYGRGQNYPIILYV